MKFEKVMILFAKPFLFFRPIFFFDFDKKFKLFFKKNNLFCFILAETVKIFTHLKRITALKSINWFVSFGFLSCNQHTLESLLNITNKLEK